MKVDKKGLIKLSVSCLLLLAALVPVYFALRLPVSYDEAWTFLNFTSKEWSASVCHYPAPNNHVLHSILTKIFYSLPGLSNLFKLRLPVLLFNAACLLLFYRFLSKNFNAKIALVCTTMAASLFMGIYYGYMSRGYGLVSLCFVGAFSGCYNIVKNGAKLKYWLGLGIFSVVGFYAIPTFLYPFVSLNVFLLLQFQKSWTKAFLATNFSVCVATILLYLPIILTDGLESITANTYVEPIGLATTLRTLPRFFIDILEQVSRIPWPIVLFLLAISGFCILKSKNKVLMLWTLCLFAVPALLLLLQRVIPFHRVFNYFGFALVFVLLVPFSGSIRKLRYRYLIPAVFGLQMLLIWNFSKKIDAYEDKDLALNTTAGKIIPEIMGDKRYLFRGTLLPTNLEFELIDKGFKHYKIDYFPGTDADSVMGYDYVIIEKEADRTQKAKPVFKTAYYNIYRK